MVKNKGVFQIDTSIILHNVSICAEMFIES